MINIYVIGCGGIGGYLLELLPMCIASINLDVLYPANMGNTQTYKGLGEVPMPSIVDRITLIDGDAFDPHNSVRQASGDTAGSKVIGRLESFLAYKKMTESNSGLLYTWLSALEVQGARAYVTPDNISKLIPRTPERNVVNESLVERFENGQMANSINRRYGKLALNQTVVFLCVDNDKTRLEVSKYMETFDNCLLISGGNTKMTGNVLVYERELGVALDPPIYEMFDNIKHPRDKRPDEASCTDVATYHDQVANTNCMLATWMSVLFSRWVREGLDDERGRVNEILIDTESYTVDGIRHMM